MLYLENWVHFEFKMRICQNAKIEEPALSWGHASILKFKLSIRLCIADMWLMIMLQKGAKEMNIILRCLVMFKIMLLSLSSFHLLSIECFFVL